MFRLYICIIKKFKYFFIFGVCYLRFVFIVENLEIKVKWKENYVYLYYLEILLIFCIF